MTRRKLPNVYQSCPKMISLEKWKMLTPLQNLPKNVWDLGKLTVAKGFQKLPKVQKIAKSGHTAPSLCGDARNFLVTFLFKLVHLPLGRGFKSSRVYIPFLGTNAFSFEYYQWSIFKAKLHPIFIYSLEHVTLLWP